MFNYKWIKNLMISVISFSSLVAIGAPNEWLNCKPNGAAISELNLSFDNAALPKSVRVQSSQLLASGESTIERFSEMVPSSFDTMNRAGRFVIILKNAQSVEWGGGSSDTALLTLTRLDLKGNYISYLAQDGFVYTMSCSKK